ncbi:MAG: hypothetical protein BWY82_02864 [Verrucomicrobia bacterium ADurb.Bin474]|nr:MAG: hypothetical protein BWY82_02864 [Verrucomicrobia bacterium ADurb.Bin474]
MPTITTSNTTNTGTLIAIRLIGNSRVSNNTRSGTNARALCRIRTMLCIRAKQPNHRHPISHGLRPGSRWSRTIRRATPPTQTNNIAVQVSFQSVFKYQGRGESGVHNRSASRQASHGLHSFSIFGSQSRTRMAVYWTPSRPTNA